MKNKIVLAIVLILVALIVFLGYKYLYTPKVVDNIDDRQKQNENYENLDDNDVQRGDLSESQDTGF